jgi:hypothetical protein
VDVLGCHIGTFWHALREHTVSDGYSSNMAGNVNTFQYGTGTLSPGVFLPVHSLKRAIREFREKT